MAILLLCEAGKKPFILSSGKEHSSSRRYVTATKIFSMAVRAFSSSAVKEQ